MHTSGSSQCRTHGATLSLFGHDFKLTWDIDGGKYIAGADPDDSARARSIRCLALGELIWDCGDESRGDDKGADRGENFHCVRMMGVVGRNFLWKRGKEEPSISGAVAGCFPLMYCP